MTDKWHHRGRQESELPPIPKNVFETFDCIKQINQMLHEIKTVLAAHQMAPAPPNAVWELPITEDDLIKTVHCLLIDLQMVKEIMLENQLADEIEFMPLTPRWRIDGKKHHQRNALLFELNVREVLEDISNKLPFPSWCIRRMGVTKEQIEEWRDKFEREDIIARLDQVLKGME